MKISCNTQVSQSYPTPAYYIHITTIRHITTKSQHVNVLFCFLFQTQTHFGQIRLKSLYPREHYQHWERNARSYHKPPDLTFDALSTPLCGNDLVPIQVWQPWQANRFVLLASSTAFNVHPFCDSVFENVPIYFCVLILHGSMRRRTLTAHFLAFYYISQSLF